MHKGVLSWIEKTGCPGFWHGLVLTGCTKKNYGARAKEFECH